MTAPLLLHVREVCELTNYSKAHVHRLIQRGELPCVRSGRAVRVPRAALLRWIADQSGQPIDLPEHGETADCSTVPTQEVA